MVGIRAMFVYGAMSRDGVPKRNMANCPENLTALNDDIYSAFVQHDSTLHHVFGAVADNDRKAFNIKQPDSDEVECFKTTITLAEKDNVKFIFQNIVNNYYTPIIYEKAIAKHKSLKLMDAFFMSSSGLRKNTATIKDSLFTAAIVRKTPFPVIP